ncbi:hypothetical protein MMC21_003797 [Puttea exsequens]|nr:hypothetical protein [Puttea exsequens]
MPSSDPLINGHSKDALVDGDNKTDDSVNGSNTHDPNPQQFLAIGDKEEFDPDNWTTSSCSLPKRCPETHVNVLIVGGGPAGLVTALESWRKGHNVVGILERSQGPVYAGSSFFFILLVLTHIPHPREFRHLDIKYKKRKSADDLDCVSTGDIIVIGPSALCTLRHWPDLCRELEADRTDSVMYYRQHTGSLILGPTSLESNSPAEGRSHGLSLSAEHQIRKKFYRMLLRHVALIGLKVSYDQRVERYFEDEVAGVGGVVTADGKVSVADIVVAADAMRTSSELLIAGKHMPTRSSGMSVYRTAVPTELAMRDEAFRKRWGEVLEKGISHHEFWIGPGMHLGLYVSPDFVAYGLTPRDKFLLPGGDEPTESWDPDVDPEEVVKVLCRIPDWDPAIVGLVRATPKGGIVHWPLLWRNLRREWTSKGGRVVQVGDAAHSTIPASISGGTLAIEDAVTLATCLQLACSGGGGSGTPLGARIYNLLRYQRISCAQKMSFVNSESLGALNLDEVKKDPDKIRVRFPKWLFQHDPEAYAYEKYGQAFAHLMLGAEFQNTNFPQGHKFRPWTIEEIHEDALAGKSVTDLLDGDWS